MLERTSLSRRFRAEQRQLAATRVGPDQREIVLLVDDVHAEPARELLGDRLAVGKPEGDVIQGLGLHVASVPAG